MTTKTTSGRRNVAVGVLAALLLAGAAAAGALLVREDVEALPETDGQWVGMRRVAVEVGADWAHGRACDEHGTVNSYAVDAWRFIDPHCRGEPNDERQQATLVSFSPVSPETDEDQLAQAPGHSDAPVTATQVDGRRALRSEIVCTELGERTSGNGFVPATVRRCTAAMALPDEGVALALWSTDGEEAIERLLDSVRVFEEHVAVPGASGALTEYRDEAADLGLRVEVSRAPGRESTSTVTRVEHSDPGPGQFVRRGTTVRLEVVGNGTDGP